MVEQKMQVEQKRNHRKQMIVTSLFSQVWDLVLMAGCLEQLYLLVNHTVV
uniref:Uncharacterized protein n=1 Tax=uncultured marine virus TaxID=186617 RepID=A0A0F7L9L1_9VIRU|nr:hypothetical protein [uncultured marine virus]